MPTNELNATVRAEFDSQYRELRTISAQGTYTWTQRVQATVGWSKTAFIAELPGFNDPDDPRPLHQRVDERAHAATTGSAAIYSFNYDVLRSTLLQQRISGFYNAQCCGLAFEYQTYNLRPASRCADPGRPPLLPVVHARRPRQLLAVQRRAERRAALSRRRRCRATDSRHRRRRVRRQPPARPARRATAPTSSPGTGPAASPPRDGPVSRWEAVDLLDRDAVAAAIARAAAGGRVSLRRRAHVGRSWDATEPTFATNVRGTHHLLEALERRRRSTRAC